MPEQPISRVRDKPDLAPPGQTADAASASGRAYLGLWIALAAVLLIGLAVILVLPRLIDSTPDTLADSAGVEPVVAATQLDANAAMQSYLQLRGQLEHNNAAVWGEPEWREAGQSATQGARQLAQRQFSQAANQYNQALGLLQHLEQTRDQRLDAALQRAQTALAENQLEQALLQFQQVLAIDAQHESAQFGLARAQIRPAVLDNLLQGEQAEMQGDLLAAQAAYQEAAMLDPGYEPPASAFARVTAELEAEAFDDAISRLLTALEARQLSVAGKALAEARALRPTDPVVVDARQRLQLARQQVRLDGFRRRAAQSVKNEQWQAAIALYKQALRLDDAAAFALDGLEKAEQRVTLNKQFDHYLGKPERLYAAQPLQNAEALLASTGQAPAGEPRLAKKIATLTQRVAAASTPVFVNLSSDGKTDISIYHIGQLGAFNQYQIDLLPGTYTVVGSRYGYRDVHKTLKVTPGAENATLFIRCEEPI